MASKSASREGLTALTVPELRQRARRQGIRGASQMKKADLVEAMAGATSGASEKKAPAKRKEPAATEPARRTGPRAAKQPVKKPAKKTARSAKKPAKKPAKKTAKKTAKKSAKKSAKTAAASARKGPARKAAPGAVRKSARKKAGIGTAKKPARRPPSGAVPWKTGRSATGTAPRAPAKESAAPKRVRATPAPAGPRGRPATPPAAGENPAVPEAPPSLLPENSFSFLPLGPRRIFACWTWDPAEIERARAAVGDPAAVTVLRVHDRTLIEFDDLRAQATFDIEVTSSSGDHYLDDLFPGRTYQAELGVRAGSGDFHSLALSELAETPREGRGARVSERLENVAGTPARRWTPRAAPPRPAAGAESTPSPGSGEPAAHRVPVADAAIDLEFGEPMRFRAGLEPALLGASAALEETGESRAESSRRAEGQVAPDAASAVAEGAGENGDPLRLQQGLRPTGSIRVESSRKPGVDLPASAARGAADLPSSLELVHRREGISGVSSLGLIPLVEEIGAEEEEEQGTLRLELHADLVVYGRTDPEASLYVDHVRVPVRPDGTFDARFALGRARGSTPPRKKKVDGPPGDA